MTSATSLLSISSKSSSIGNGQTRSPLLRADLQQIAVRRGAIREHARVALGERDDARARERRVVDDEIRLLAARERERVGEHHPAFRVGVDDLDARAVRGVHDVLRLVRSRAPSRFSEIASHASTPNGTSSDASASNVPSATALPCMSMCMSNMPLNAFKFVPPVSNRMPLPTSASCGSAFRAAADSSDAAMPASRSRIALRHREERAGARACGACPR